MSLRLICGKSGTGKSNFCLEEIVNKIEKDKQIYIITPEQFSYVEEKKLLEKTKNGAIINAEVLTFNRMAYRVANEVGNTNKSNLSKSGKAMIINNILSNNKNEFTFLGKSKQNIDLIDTQITEFKKHNVKVEDLKTVIENEEDKYLKAKLQDMEFVYEKYQNTLGNSFIEENDVLTQLASQLDETNVFKDTIIYIDEFVGFTNQEYSIIEKLLKTAIQVNITITVDNLDMGTNQDVDLFYSNKQTADKLLFIARNNNVNCEKTIFLKENYRLKGNDLKHLEENIYRVPYKIYDKEVKNIEIFLANNSYTEVENVAKQIVKLVKYKNYRYKDIIVISKNLDEYSSLCKAIFNEYKIPNFIDEKKELSQNVFVKYVISILDVYAQNWSYESVINYVKTDFLKIDKDDVYSFENYTRKWGIKGSKWYKNEWNFGDQNSKNEEKISHIKQLRKQIVEPLYNLKEDIKENKTVEQITKKIYEFLIENKINEVIKYNKEKLKEQKEVELANEQEVCWNTIMNLFDEIIQIFGTQKISFERYTELLRTGLNYSGLGKIPATQDQVIVGDVDRTKSNDVKAIFILGINDGILPSIYKKEGFFNDKDRETLKQKNIELAKGTLERLYEDKFSIYKIFSIAEEKVFLSYVSSSLDGSTLRPSMLITKIKKIFPKIKEESDMIYVEDEIITPNSTFNELIKNIRDYKESGKIEDIWFQIFKYYKNDEKWEQKLTTAIQALSYTNTASKIEKENIEKLYGNTLNTSVSKLEQYKRCAFSYYLKYGLKLSSKDNFKIQLVDTGSFMHETIDEFFNIVNERNMKVKQLEEKEISNIIEEIIQEKLNLGKNYIFTSSAKYKMLINRLKRVILKSMKYIIQSLKNSDFEVYGNEIEFKDGKKYDPISLKLKDGKKVEITGKIDRIDIAKDNDGKYMRIIDYKSSVKSIDLNEVMAGMQIQLLTYLDATCKIEELIPAGILYFSLIDPIVKSDKSMTDEQIENEIQKRFKMQGIVLADVKIVKMMDKSLEAGQSNIIPAYISKEGNLSKGKSNVVTREQFEDLQNYTNKIIKEISEEILSGKIEIKPYYNIKTKRTPCEYCEYTSICQFNNGICKNEYNYIGKKTKEEILEEIKKVKK